MVASSRNQPPEALWATGRCEFADRTLVTDAIAVARLRVPAAVRYRLFWRRSLKSQSVPVARPGVGRLEQ